jgi:hypothetical protein
VSEAADSRFDSGAFMAVLAKMYHTAARPRVSRSLPSCESSMTPMTLRLEDLAAREGDEVGVSPWLLVDQARIDRFADAIEDGSGFTSIRSAPAKGRSARRSHTAFSPSRCCRASSR